MMEGAPPIRGRSCFISRRSTGLEDLVIIAAQQLDAPVEEGGLQGPLLELIGQGGPAAHLGVPGDLGESAAVLFPIAADIDRQPIEHLGGGDLRAPQLGRRGGAVDPGDGGVWVGDPGQIHGLGLRGAPRRGARSGAGRGILLPAAAERRQGQRQGPNTFRDLHRCISFPARDSLRTIITQIGTQGKPNPFM